MASSAGAIRAGAAFVEILADDSKMRRTLAASGAWLKKFGSMVSAIGTTMLRAGTVALAPLIASSKLFASMGSELAKASSITGIAVENLSMLKFAAEQVDVPFEVLVKSLEKFSKTLVAAANGNTGDITALSQLGLDAQKLAQMAPEEQIAQIAGAMQKIKNPNLKMSLAQQLFGKGGAELLPLLNQGEEGIRRFNQIAKEMGLVMSGEDARAALQFSQEMKIVWDVVKMAAFQVGAAFSPVLREVGKVLVTAANNVRQFASEHKGIIQLVGKLAISFVTVGAGLRVIGGVLSGFGSLLTGVNAAIGLARTALMGIVSVASSIVATIGAPVLIVTAIVAGLSAAFLYLTETGAAVRAYLGQVWSALADDFKSIFDGMKDALSAGDWKLAAQILWLGVKVEWAKGVAAVKSVFLSLKQWWLDGWEELSSAVLTTWSYLTEYLSNWDGVKTAAMKLLTWLEGSFRAAVDHIADTIQELFMTTGKKQLQIDIDIIHKKELAKIADINQNEKSGQITHEEAERQREGAKNEFGRQRQNAQRDALVYDDKARADRDKNRQDEQAAKQKALDDAYQQSHPNAVGSAEVERERIRNALAAERKRIEQEIAAERGKGEEADEAKISALRRQFEAAKEQAAKENREVNAPGIPRFNPDDARGGVEESMKKTAGTFNASVAFGLGSAGGPLVKNTQKTVTVLEKIYQKMNLNPQGLLPGGLGQALFGNS